jgi:phosphate transport system substrate-binding protein
MRFALAATILSAFAAHGFASESVRIQGSVDVFDRVGAALTARFSARYGDVSLAWDEAGSGAAFTALFAGEADLGVSTRTIAAQELELARRLGLELTETALALDGLAVIVHPDNHVSRLTMKQLETLYLGRIVRWLGFGGIDETVNLLSSPDAGGTQRVFKKLVLGDPTRSFPRSTVYLWADDIVDRVAVDRGAVGFVSMNRDLSGVRTVPIEGPAGQVLRPDIGSVASGAYPLCYAIWLYRMGEAAGELRHFLRFLLLHDGQRVLAEDRAFTGSGVLPARASTCPTS